MGILFVYVYSGDKDVMCSYVTSASAKENYILELDGLFCLGYVRYPINSVYVHAQVYEKRERVCVCSCLWTVLFWLCQISG